MAMQDAQKRQDPQKSEVHRTTGDADSSPTPGGPAAGRSTEKTSPDRPARPIEPMPPDTRIVRDETDVGGPLYIESDAPGLKHPDVPKDPFPTLGTPEIDPPVEK